MGKSLSSDSARARSQKQQKEASRHTAPDARERIPTGAGEVARSYHFYGANQITVRSLRSGNQARSHRRAQLDRLSALPSGLRLKQWPIPSQ